MTRIPTPADSEFNTVEIDATPVTLRLPRGTVVYAVRGEAWLTQERRLEDVILAPGQHYDLATSEPIVVSATRDRATLHVARPVGTCQRLARDVYDLARCRAQALRRAELSRLGDAVTGSARALLLRLRSSWRRAAA